MIMLRTDSLDFALHATAHDLVFTRGDVSLTSGSDGIAQDVKIAVQMIAGEWFYNLDEGIALYRREGIDPNRVILGAKFDKARVLSEFTNAIRTVDGVQDIVSMAVTFDVATRTVSVRYAVRTIFGDTFADSLAVGGGSNA
jgi:3-hydroxyisobutyrate dehydrogenase-like beta-hydroxyacid dehydrogenase